MICLNFEEEWAPFQCGGIKDGVREKQVYLMHVRGQFTGGRSTSALDVLASKILRMEKYSESLR